VRRGDSVLFRVLGPLEALHEGRSLPLGGAKQRALLAILLLHANRPVSTDTIVDQLWGEHPPPSSAKVVQVYVSQLRKALEYVDESGVTSRGITTTAGGYSVELEPDQLDVLLFAALVARGRRAQDSGATERASELLGEALALWRGQALADFEFEQFAAAEIARLEDMRLSTLEARIEADLALGRHAEVTGELEALLGSHAARESLAGLLMLALYRSGRQAEAIAKFKIVRRYLVDELGLEPSVELREMHQRMLNQDDSLRWVPRAHSPHNLPSPSTSFVGRSADLAELAPMLDRGRLVTLTGPGGAGKSRLAVELATSLIDGLETVQLVELTEIYTARELLASIAASLGESEGINGDMGRTVAAAIGDREVLLVLDNAEHLVDDVATAVRQLLGECPRLRFLVTSREALAIPEEHAYAVGPLTSSSAIQLFGDRATAVIPDLQIDEDSATYVEQIVRRLDGLPLALELAASLVRAMSPAEISSRLDDQLNLLSSDSRTPIRRHRTLRDLVEWSFSLLDDEERRVLQGLSVFSGGFTLAAAEVVCGAGTLAVLTRLVRKSLVSAEDWAGDKRFRLLETVRAYAAEALDGAGETDAWQTRHAEYYLALAEEAEPHLKSAGQRTWLAAIRREDDNLRAALQFFIAGGDNESECRLTGALWRPSYLSGHYSACRGWLEAALKHEEVDLPVRVRALHGAGALALYQCDYDVASGHLTGALETYAGLGDDHGRAGVLTLLGSIARERGDYARALALHQEAEQICRVLGDDWGTASALELASLASWLNADFDGSWVLCGEGLEAARAVQDEERIGWCRVDLAAISHYLDDEEEAQRQLAEAVSSFEALGFKEGIAWSLNVLGVVHATAGRTDEAMAALTQSLRLHRELGDRWRLGSVLEAIASALVHREEYADAAILLRVAERLRTDIGTPVPPCERPVYDAAVAAVHAQLDEAALTRANRRATTLSLDEACSRVLTLIA
jgi:predicted ATPase/DNA-binding SARP family transcriptional activator